MSRLLNLLGFVAFVLGAACLGYALYLLLAGSFGFNPWGTARPTGGRETMIVTALIGLGLVVVGLLLAFVSARMEARRRVVVVHQRPLGAPVV